MLDQKHDMCVNQSNDFAALVRYTNIRPKPRLFGLILRDDKKFDNIVYVEIFYIESKPVLHVVHEAAYFQSARCLS